MNAEMNPDSDAEDGEDDVYEKLPLWEYSDSMFDCLPGQFEVKVDTAEFPTACGCGHVHIEQGKRQRAEPPWLGDMLQDVAFGTMLTQGPWVDTDPLTLGFRMTQFGPRLSTVRMHLTLCAETQGECISFPVPIKDIVAIDTLEWA